MHTLYKHAQFLVFVLRNYRDLCITDQSSTSYADCMYEDDNAIDQSNLVYIAAFLTELSGGITAGNNNTTVQPLAFQG